MPLTFRRCSCFAIRIALVTSRSPFPSHAKGTCSASYAVRSAVGGHTRRAGGAVTHPRRPNLILPGAGRSGIRSRHVVTARGAITSGAGRLVSAALAGRCTRIGTKSSLLVSSFFEVLLVLRGSSRFFQVLLGFSSSARFYEVTGFDKAQPRRNRCCLGVMCS